MRIKWIISCWLVSLQALGLPSISLAGKTETTGNIQSTSLSCEVHDKSFEELLKDFSDNFKYREEGETEEKDQAAFCQFQRLIMLSQMIERDMILKPQDYERKMQNLEESKDISSDAKDFVGLAFYERWLSLSLDHILLQEQESAGISAQWVSGGLAAVVVGTMIVPAIRTLGTKSIRLFRRLLPHMFQNLFRSRILIAGSPSAISQRNVFDQEGQTEIGRLIQVKSPLSYFHDSGEVLPDERTEDIFVNFLYRDLTVVGSGVFLGTVTGKLAANYFPPTTWKEVLSRFKTFDTSGRVAKLLGTRIGNALRPQVLVGLSSTFLVTAASVKLGLYFDEALRYKDMKEKISNWIVQIKSNTQNKNHYEVWKTSDNIRNELLISQSLLKRNYFDSLYGIMGDALEEISNVNGSDCQISNTQVKEIRIKTRRQIEKVIDQHKLAIVASMDLTNIASEAFVNENSPFLQPLKSHLRSASLRDQADLDSGAVLSFYWPSLAKHLPEATKACLGQFALPHGER